MKVVYVGIPEPQKLECHPGNAPGILVEVEGRAFSPKIARSSGKRWPGGQCHGGLVYVFVFFWGVVFEKDVLLGVCFYWLLIC